MHRRSGTFGVILPVTGTAIAIEGFVVGTEDMNGKLRAERVRSEGERTYSLTYTATDKAGNSASCVTTVRVPASKGKS